MQWSTYADWTTAAAGKVFEPVIKAINDAWVLDSDTKKAWLCGAEAADAVLPAIDHREPTASHCYCSSSAVNARHTCVTCGTVDTCSRMQLEHNHTKVCDACFGTFPEKGGKSMLDTPRKMFGEHSIHKKHYTAALEHLKEQHLKHKIGSNISIEWLDYLRSAY
jgi:hypothetical protein